MNPTVELILKLMDQVSGPLDNVTERFGILFSRVNMTQVALNRMQTGAVQFGSGMAASIPFKMLFDQASDLNETLSKTNVIFGQNTQSVLDWAKTSDQAMGLSEAGALGAASTFGNLFTALGVNQNVAADFSMNLTQLASDLASFNNTSTDDALMALRSAMVGEMDPIQRYGAALNDTYLKQEAFRLGLIKSTKVDLDPLTKMYATYSLVLKQTSSAHGDFARTADSAANMQRIMIARFQNLTTQIGQVLLPVGVRLLQWILDIITRVQEFAREHPNLVRWITLAALAIVGMQVAVGALNIAFGGFLLLVIQVSAAIGVFRVLHLVLAMIAGVSGGMPFMTTLTTFLRAGIIQRTTMLFRGLGVVGMWAIRGIGMAIRANPLGFVLTLVVGLLLYLGNLFVRVYNESAKFREQIDAALTPLQNTLAVLQAQIHLFSETYKQMVVDLQTSTARMFGFDKPQQMFDAFLYNIGFGLGFLTGVLLQIGILLATWFTNIFADIIQAGAGFWMMLSGLFTGNSQQVMTGQKIMLDALKRLWDRTLGGVLRIIFTWAIRAYDGIKDGIQKAYDWLVEMAPKWLDIGANFIKSLWTGMQQQFASLKANMTDLGWQIAEGLSFGLIKNPAANNAAQQTADGLNDTTRKALKVQSPSRVFMGIGSFLSEGLALGITGAAGKAIGAAKQMAVGVATAGMISFPAAALNLPEAQANSGLVRSLLPTPVQVQASEQQTQSKQGKTGGSASEQQTQSKQGKTGGSGRGGITIQNLNVSLPNVKDAEGFMQALKQLMEAYSE